MDQEKTSLSFSETIAAQPADVYLAFTNTGLIRQWLCNHSQVDARSGGRLYLHWQQGYYASGEFTELEPDQKVAFSWQGRGETAVSQVHITLSGDNGTTRINLTHQNIGTDETWDETRKELKQGWKSGLANLKSVLETGLDRRIYDQPFLGILISGVVTAEQAAELDLPVEGGIRISGTMAGTGAAAANLQNGDILVNLGGGETTDFPSLRAALQPFKAGEKVKVTYYREGEKQNVLMLLSQRPVPAVPETPGAFAEELRELYHQLDQELDNLLVDVTEAEASRHPAEGEWNVKEVLAHLIGTERAVQLGLAAQLTNGVLDGFPNNPPAWVRSITAVYPTLPEIVAAWKRTESETVALVAELPPQFVKQKVHYLNTGNTLLTGLPGHTRSHFDQMRAAIVAARENQG